MIQLSFAGGMLDVRHELDQYMLSIGLPPCQQDTQGRLALVWGEARLVGVDCGPGGCIELFGCPGWATDELLASWAEDDDHARDDGETPQASWSWLNWTDGHGDWSLALDPLSCDITVSLRVAPAQVFPRPWAQTLPAFEAVFADVCSRLSPVSAGSGLSTATALPGASLLKI